MTVNPKTGLTWAHPLIQEWFATKLGSPSDPQQQGWPAILAGNDTLISAPTGSGKTLAAFMICINDLVCQAVNDELEQHVQVIYVSPLKALSNDIHQNLTEPLTEIHQLAKQQGVEMREIRVAVRTGDTLARDRQIMLKKPPHILVTTPESLYILLTAEKSRTILTDVKTIIVDEIHALANNKRGAHLALTLERLCALTVKAPMRIGLSATQKPIDLIAHFLVGSQRPKPVIIDIGYVRKIYLQVEVPKRELSSVASHEMWEEIYDQITELANQHRSLLIFVNTRRLAERIAHQLTRRLGEDKVAAHHGSLSRKLRLKAEGELKQGHLKALVATGSLELGIDIGSIDLVCQIGSPRAIAIALQRVGRSGHWYGAISKGYFFPTTRDELLECAALVKAIHQRELDQLIIPQEPLDILTQQIVATCATGEWSEEGLFSLVKNAFPYRNLSSDTFYSIISMLAEGIASSRGRYGTYLFRDQVNRKIKARRGARLTAITCGGAIPENGLFSVIAEPQGTMIGTLDEDFAVESMRGDIILLGTTSWKINRIEASTGRVLVEDAHGAPPSVPFWRGEAPGRTDELSFFVAELRQFINDKLSSPDTGISWLIENCGVNQSGAHQIIEYLRQGKEVLGAIPTQKTIIAERFFDEAGGMQLIIHSPFGARINKAWGLALRKRFCRSFNFELQAAATDNGITISLTEQHSFPLADVFRFLHPNTIKDVLVQAVLQSPLFPTRWRWVATRSLALARSRAGKKVPPPILRIHSDDLLAAVFPDAAACQDNLAGKDIELPNHPLINETMKEILSEALDLQGLITVLDDIYSEKITVLAVDTPIPSVFSHELLGANPYAFLDDAPLEERRTRAVEMRRVLPESVLKEAGMLDQFMIAEVQRLAWPDVRNADELHDFLQTVIAFPENAISSEWKSCIDELITGGRIGLAIIRNNRFFYTAEKAKSFFAIYDESEIETATVEIENFQPERDEAILAMLRGWMLHLGPTTTAELTNLLLLPINDIEQALLKLETTGFILRGNFRSQSFVDDQHEIPASKCRQFNPSINKEKIEWCERRLLARIHQLTLNKLRKEIEPVIPHQFFQWLLNWQHISPNTQLKGSQGLLEIVKKLQGFEIPANAWENQIFMKRIADYDPDLLDNLCLKGIIGWARISNPFSETNIKKRVVPTSVSPITFFIRENADWLPEYKQFEHESECDFLSTIAKDIYFYLKKRGASFFFDIVRDIKHLKTEVEMGLWELVTAGLITGDGFDNLRSLIDRRRRQGRRRKSSSVIKNYSSGRWSLMQNNEPIQPEKRHEAYCWMLLKRYGIVFRDLLQREKNLPRWRDLLMIFRRLEDRGEIRGGRFVGGFKGEQFALPYAVESLRSITKTPINQQTVTLSSVDPLNLQGIIIVGERTPAMSGKSVSLKMMVNED